MDLSPETAAKAESAEFPGRAIAALAADEHVLAKSGLVLTTPELAREYGFTDVDGKQQSTFWDSTGPAPEASGRGSDSAGVTTGGRSHP
jgi:hypothetical protein